MKNHLNYIVTVRYHGKNITFAMDINRLSEDIFYRVHDFTDKEDNNITANGSWERLKFPNRLLTIGSGYNIKKLGEGEQVGGVNIPFKVISDNSYIYLFRQSVRGTLLLNRFVLHSTQVGGAQLYSVKPLFLGIGSSKIKCTQLLTKLIAFNYQGDIEPTIELSMINGLEEGNFEPLLISDKECHGYKWQVFVYDKLIRDIHIYSIPMSREGLLDFEKMLFPTDRVVTFRRGLSQGSLLPPPLFIPSKKSFEVQRYPTRQKSMVDVKKNRTTIHMMT